MGRARPARGTAAHPTDLLNAYDLSDVVDFTARVPTWAARAEYWAGGLNFTAVWSPTVHAPLMPRGGGSALLVGRSPVPSGDVRISTLDARLEPQSRSVGEGLGAFKISGNALRSDFSVSYGTGYDGMPFPKGLDLTPLDLTPEGGNDPDAFTADIGLAFTHTRTLGADLATEVGGVDVWGEATLVFSSTRGAGGNDHRRHRHRRGTPCRGGRPRLRPVHGRPWTMSS